MCARIGYLSKLMMPKGAMDFGKNLPDQDITLVSPTVELIARKDIHPALSDLLLAAAMEIHGRAALFQNRGEFPVAWENEYKISDDAKRFYKSGKTFFYRYLPFWLASLISRILVVFVPLILILIPGVKTIPALLQWRMKLRINRWYRTAAAGRAGYPRPSNRPGSLRSWPGGSMKSSPSFIRMKVPASYGDQFYALRTHIHFVRSKLQAARSC